MAVAVAQAGQDGSVLRGLICAALSTEAPRPGLTAGPCCARVPCGARRPGRACKLGLSGLRQARPAARCAAAPGRLCSSAAPTGRGEGLRSTARAAAGRAEEGVRSDPWVGGSAGPRVRGSAGPRVRGSAGQRVGSSAVRQVMVIRNTCALPLVDTRGQGCQRQTTGRRSTHQPLAARVWRARSIGDAARRPLTGPVGAAEERSRPGAAAHRAAGRACLRPERPSLHARPGRRAPQGTLAQRGPAVRPGERSSSGTARRSSSGSTRSAACGRSVQ